MNAVLQTLVFALFCVVLLLSAIFGIGYYAFLRWLRHGKPTPYTVFNGSHDCFWCGCWLGFVSRTQESDNG